MARLGEAYVRVRADLKDFDADLDKALKRSTDKFEKAFNASLGKRVGKDLGVGLSAELNATLMASTKAFVADFEQRSKDSGGRAGRSSGMQFASSFIGATKTIAKSIGGLITDGLSGLPPEVRAALGGIVLAASVPLSAGLASIIVAGTAGAVAGVGVALASQFDVVQERAKIFGTTLRGTLVEASRPFIDPILEGFERIDAFIESIDDRLTSTFANASKFVAPLTNAVIVVLDYITAGIDDLVANSDGLVDALAEGFVFLGSAIGESLTILSDLGEDGEVAIRDLLITIAQLIVITAHLLELATRAYAVFRDFTQSTSALGIATKILFPGLALLKLGFDETDAATVEADKALSDYGFTTRKYVRTTEGAIVVTEAQTRELKEQARAIDAARDAQFRAIDSTLSYLDSLSNVTKVLKENKGAFDFQSEAGREGVRTIGLAFKEAEDRARDMYVARKLNSEQAQELYRQERQEIYDNAAAWGVSKAEIDAVYGGISAILNLPVIDDKFKVLTSGITAAEEAARELRREIQRGGFTPPEFGMSASSIPGYADGGIIDKQQVAVVGEGNRREVVLPLTDPRRTRELAQQSGLMNVLGGDGASMVIVYIGNEQLDSRMYRVANRNSKDQARLMTQGPRLN